MLYLELFSCLICTQTALSNGKLKVLCCSPQSHLFSEKQPFYLAKHGVGWSTTASIFGLFVLMCDFRDQNLHIEKLKSHNNTNYPIKATVKPQLLCSGWCQRSLVAVKRA